MSTGAVIIVAAGQGLRAGEGPPKAYREVAGRPVVRRSIEAFADLVKEEPAIDVNLEELGDGGLEYRLDKAEDRELWTRVWTEVKAG